MWANFDCGLKMMSHCTSALDSKVMAMHWSLHPILMPRDLAFQRVSVHGVSATTNELMEAGFVGFTRQYCMFERLALPKFPEMRAAYARNLGPLLPGVEAQLIDIHLRPEPNGTFYKDSALVAWLRPQLTKCASERLGASYILQTRLRRLRGSLELAWGRGDACHMVPADIDYSKLPCQIWANRRQPGVGPINSLPLTKFPGSLRPPRLGSFRAFLSLYRLAPGPGRANFNTLGPKAGDSLCAIGRDNFVGLVFLFRHRSEKVATELANFKRDLRLKEDLSHCNDICTALVLGASKVASKRNYELGKEIAFLGNNWCLSTFVRHWNLMDILVAGWSGLLEMMHLLTWSDSFDRTIIHDLQEGRNETEGLSLPPWNLFGPSIIPLEGGHDKQ